VLTTKYGVPAVNPPGRVVPDNVTVVPLVSVAPENTAGVPLVAVKAKSVPGL
jgi:hypothetical protein